MAIALRSPYGHRSIAFLLTSMLLCRKKMKGGGGREGGEGEGGRGGGEEGGRGEEGEGREGAGREVAFRGLSERPEAHRGHVSPSRLKIDEVDTDVEDKE